MEIESKFDMVDSCAERLLSAARALGRFTLGPAKTRVVVDHYVDTAQRDCLSGGYACRFRRTADAAQVTFKATSAPDSTGTFQREEVEQPLEVSTSDPSEWPDGPARSLAIQLCGFQPLLPLLVLHQVRCVRPVFAGARSIGILTVDRVRPQAGDKEAADYHVVEFELGADGTESDLRAITAALNGVPGLVPSTESKLARGLAALQAGPPRP